MKTTPIYKNCGYSVPQKPKEYEFYCIQLHMFNYNEQLRKVRACHNDKLDKCKKCGRKFKENEQIALAFSHKHNNMVMCVDCAKELFEVAE